MPTDPIGGAQFRKFVRHIGTSGVAWTADCGELVRLLAFTGCHIGEMPRGPIIPDANEVQESTKARGADPAYPVSACVSNRREGS